MRFAGAKYHLTVRGNGRERVFFGDEDYTRFLEQLDAALATDEVILYAYVLMPNHYHLFVETPLGNVQRFMQRLNTAYGMYFRYKHTRPGHCFQGRYGAKLVEGDGYILALTRYIHLNPVKGTAWAGESLAKKQAQLKAFAWSSFRGYAGEGPEEERVDYRWLSLMERVTRKGCQAAYRRYVAGMLAKDDEAFLADEGKSPYVIGDAKARERAEEELKAKLIERAVTGDIVWPEDRRPELSEVEAAVRAEFGMTAENLRFHGHRLGALKSVALELCCRYSGVTQRAVAAHFGYRSEGAVGKARRIAQAALATDPALNRQAKRVEKRLRQENKS
jgi:REP element-mobilizing transposase RayT